MIIRLETAFIEYLAICQRDKINYFVERDFIISRCHFTHKKIKHILKKETDNLVNVVRKCDFNINFYYN